MRGSLNVLMKHGVMVVELWITRYLLRRRHRHVMKRRRMLRGDIRLLLIPCKLNYILSNEDYLVRGRIIATTDEKEMIVYADLETALVEEARSSIPVSKQRRFDVYPDVSKGK